MSTPSSTDRSGPGTSGPGTRGPATFGPAASVPEAACPVSRCCQLRQGAKPLRRAERELPRLGGPACASWSVAVPLSSTTTVPPLPTCLLRQASRVSWTGWSRKSTSSSTVTCAPAGTEASTALSRGSERKLHEPSITTRQRFPSPVPAGSAWMLALATRQRTSATARTRPVKTPTSRLMNTTQNRVTP
ncbi:hypothetical protein D9M72_535930 [compost metagenome]